MSRPRDPNWAKGFLERYGLLKEADRLIAKAAGSGQLDGKSLGVLIEERWLQLGLERKPARPGRRGEGRA